MITTMRRTTAALTCGLILSGALLAGCGDDGDEEAEEAFKDSSSEAADQTVCAADATALSTPYADDFPTAFTFPEGSVVYSAEDRGDTGVIVTAVSTAPFDDILDFLNKDEVANGFAITEGETEEDDAEANWKSEDYTGRWAIRKSATCDGETVIQVLATPVS